MDGKMSEEHAAYEHVASELMSSTVTGRKARAANESIHSALILSALDAHKAAVQRDLEALSAAILAAVGGPPQPDAMQECRSLLTSTSKTEHMWPAIIAHRALEAQDVALFHLSPGDSFGGQVIAQLGSRRATLLNVTPTFICQLQFGSVWDFVGSLIVLYDLVFTPLLVIGQIELSGAWLRLWWCACAFWTLEVIYNFFKPRTKDNESITKFADTSRYYLKTWFAFDFCLVIIDIVSLSIDLRFLRLARLLNVWHITKLLRRVQNMSAWIMSRGVRLAVRVCYFALGFLLASHLFGCAFRYLGDGVGAAEGWIDGNSFAGRHVMNAGTSAELYIISLQWAFAHLCMGATDVIEVTILERSFSVLVWFLGLAINCSVISLFSALIVQYMWSDMEKDLMLEELRIFMHQHSANHDICSRVMSQATHVMSKRKTYLEIDVSALQAISSTLRKELLCGIRLPYLLSHELFMLWDRLDSSSLGTLCEEAITFDFFSHEEQVFDAGDEARRMLVLVQGQAAYIQHPKPSNRSFLERFPKAALPRKVTSRCVPTGLWISEASLWSNWIHVGQLLVKQPAQFLAVSAEVLPKVIRAHPIIGQISTRYSKNFHTRIVSSTPPIGTYPDDLHVPNTELHELLSSQFSIEALLEATRSGKLTLNNDQSVSLQRELQDEKCSFRLNKASKRYERYVSLSIMRLSFIESFDDAFFVEVGSYDCSNETLQSKCVLPAVKRSVGELPIDAVSRLVEKYFEPFTPFIRLLDLEHSVEIMVSEEYGIETVYDKSVHVAALGVSLADLMLVHAEPLGTRSVLDEVLVGLPSVFVLPCSGKKRLLGAWVTPAQYEMLKDSKPYVKKWLESLDIKKAVELTDCPMF